jgi:DNA-binding response OmpR family regulator
MLMSSILVLEDDVKLNRIICTHLTNNGYDARGYLDADSALDAFRRRSFDLLVSDILMPGTDGFGFVERIRAENHEVPILFVTALDDFSYKERGFTIGIDDYMVKPINLDELVLRVKALLRRMSIETERRIVVGSLVMDADKMTASVDGTIVPLAVREFRILFKLLSLPRHTFSRAQLIEEFWNSDTGTNSRVVDVYVTKLRAKFSHCDDFVIETVYGLGYRAVLT